VEDFGTELLKVTLTTTAFRFTTRGPVCLPGEASVK